MRRKSKAQNGAANGAEDEVAQDNDVQEDTGPAKQVAPEQKPLVKAQTSLDDKKEEVKAPVVERSSTTPVKKENFETKQKVQSSPVEVSKRSNSQSFYSLSSKISHWQRKGNRVQSSTCSSKRMRYFIV